MGEFEPVVIERRGGRYHLEQQDVTALAIPEVLFDRYEQGSAFPPSWEAKGNPHPVRRLYWHPDTREFLMVGLDAHPVRTVESYGTAPYRSYLHALWLPDPPVLLLRPHWNPADPQAPFDLPAREHSLATQLQFHDLLSCLRPPPGWTCILNATEAYLRAMGIQTPGSGIADPEAVEELALTPPLSLTSRSGAQALHQLATRQTGDVLPVLSGNLLRGCHCLGLPELHQAETILAQLGVEARHGVYRPH